MGSPCRAWLPALLLPLLLSGCFGDGCRRVETYPHADVPVVPMPDNATLDAALAQSGWRRLDGAAAYAQRDLPEDRAALLYLGIPDARVAGGSGLFVAAPETLVATEAEARAILAPAIEPLVQALGSGPPVYRGGIEHCGEV